MNFTWSGKTALVTGGSSELALALAPMMIQAGIQPVMTYRNETGLAKIQSTLSIEQKRYETVHLDFSNPETLSNINQLSDKTPDYLVDFAQGDFVSLIASADSDKTAAFISESITFRAEMLKRVSRMMMTQRKGRLLFVSSTAAKSPNRGQGYYSAVKLAGEALYKNIGIELGRKGITSVSLRPGYIETGRAKQYIRDNELEIINKIPIRRVLSSSEVAETIMFFLSDSARGFNATEIVMDGGLTAGK